MTGGKITGPHVLPVRLLVHDERPDQTAQPGLLLLPTLATRQRPPPHEARVPIRGQHQREQG